ncbi:hypothetical protein SAMN05216184_102101 [Georgenia satyanarayanai]|uniref:Uncharacterized protein n=1 Tax=Georgenia satyanarayanai TaxID=860221 RepID=A0A2Y9C485_9MICO|nr:hypothetical protein A8987_102101 [Georgenia satyanarayanai]SSA39183.1 hypothetical protein SAMN05216184_102101 [Georgenia satyanarayanai]
MVVGLALILFGYLVPHLVHSRHQLAESRVEDRFSGTLRVVTTGATARRSSVGEHHGTRESRPYLHDPRRRTEAPAVNRPTTPSERAAAEARRLAQLRAARAAEISRRKAAARRRLVLTVVLLLASVGGWLGFGLSSLPIALGVVPTVLLAGVLVLGRRAAKVAARRNAADRAAMARLAPQPAPRTRLAPAARPAAAPAGGSPAAGGASAAAHGEAPAEDAATAEPAEAPVAEEPSASDENPAPAVVAEVAGVAPAGQSGTRSWTPVQVPVPTYTLKASAPRRDIAPYEAPEPQPVAEEAPAAPAAPAEPVVVVSGLAGSPYAPVADPEPEAAPAADALPARGLDLDSVLARRRAVGA